VIEFYRQQGLLQAYAGTETNKIWPHVRRGLEAQLH